MVDHDQKCILLLGQFNAKPLHNACKQGHCNVVKVLMEHEKLSDSYCREQLRTDTGADSEGEHQTPLHIAANQGHTQIVEVLLKKCSELNIKLGSLRNKHGQTPVHTAAYSGREE